VRHKNLLLALLPCNMGRYLDIITARSEERIVMIESEGAESLCGFQNDPRMREAVGVVKKTVQPHHPHISDVRRIYPFSWPWDRSL
jgi:hypothetical protein